MSSVMPIHQSHSCKRGFPLRLFAVAFVVGLLTTVFSGWQAWQMHNRFHALSDEHLHITENVGRIMLLDEVLTMSARMAASTGESAYEKRYDQFDPQLTTAINAVRAMLPQSEIERFVGETDEANLALVKMERQAFALSHQGRRQEATTLLSSDEYMRLKKVYADGMEKTADAVKLVIERDHQHLRYLALLSAAANIVGILVLLATWFFAARSARSWAAERREAEDMLRKAHDELEVQVKQRTADILSTSEQLRHEIFEHKRIELVLLESERKLRKITESANDAIITGTGTGNIVDWNAAAERLFGYTEAEIIGQPLTVLMPERFRNLHSVGLARVVAGGTPHLIGKTVEVFGLRKDGSEFPLDLSLAQWQAADSQFFTAIIRDITERKQAEISLRNSEARLKTIVENLTEGIAVSDLDGQLLHFNRAALDLHGFTTLDECRQHLTKFSEMFELSAMDGTVWPVGQWPLARILRGESLRDLEVRIRHIQAGWQRIYSYGGTLVRDDGQPLMALVTISDITESKRLESELRENEARYRRITEGLTDYQYTVRIENGRAVETTQSQACETVTGYTAEEFAANPYLWIQMVVPEDRERVIEHVQQILAGNDVSPIEHRIIRKNGKILWISDTDILFRDTSGKLLSYDGVIKDITERKLADVKLAEQLNELQRWYEATLGREMRSIELKREVNELLKQTGQSPRYPSAESSNSE